MRRSLTIMNIILTVAIAGILAAMTADRFSLRPGKAPTPKGSKGLAVPAHHSPRTDELIFYSLILASGLFAMIGIKNGDVLQRLNDFSMDSPGNAL